MSREPYISVVVVGRNDGSRGAVPGRIQTFLQAWCSQSKRYELPSEVVVVEWNPVADRPKLIDSVQRPAESDCCKVHWVEVPPEIHRRFNNPDTIPLHELIAKNAGIRRARGEFVLGTNLDVIFSAELMKFLSERRLEHGRLYRINRHEVAGVPPAEATVEEVLVHSEGHMLRVCAAEGEFELAPDGLRVLEEKDIAARDAGIRLGAGWYPLDSDEAGCFRWIGAEAETIFRRPAGAEPRLVIDAETGPSAGGRPVVVEVTDPAGSVLASAELEGRRQLRLHFPDPIWSATLRLRVRGGGVPLAGDPRFLNLRVFGLWWEPAWSLEVTHARAAAGRTSAHFAASPFAAQMRNPAFLDTNGCGDFTLLARDHWFALRGYAEFPIPPRHLDSLFCYAAHHAGIREVVLCEPMRLFHRGRFSGASWTPRDAAEAIRNRDASQWIDQMRRFDAPMIFNKSNWGLADLTLRETTL